jgi:hypothetical protein
MSAAVRSLKVASALASRFTKLLAVAVETAETNSTAFAAAFTARALLAAPEKFAGTSVSPTKEVEPEEPSEEPLPFPEKERISPHARQGSSKARRIKRFIMRLPSTRRYTLFRGRKQPERVKEEPPKERQGGSLMKGGNHNHTTDSEGRMNKPSTVLTGRVASRGRVVKPYQGE